MNNLKKYKPIPWFLPGIMTLIILSILFLFGLNEQRKLVSQSIDSAIEQRTSLSTYVAMRIETTFETTQASSKRLAAHLSSMLADEIPYNAITFDSLFERLPDKSIRSKKNSFNPNIHAGIWLPENTELSEKSKSMLVMSKYGIETYGLGAKNQPYVNTWFMHRNGGISIYWPDETNYIYQASASFSYSDTPWMQLGTPENNPKRASYWTELSLDPVPNIWMLSAVSPIYVKESWVGVVGHDLPLHKLLNETKPLNEQEGSQFLLVNSKGKVIASDIYSRKLKENNGQLDLAKLPESGWQEAFKIAYEEKSSGTFHKSVLLNNKLFLASKIKGQNWLLITSMPLSPIIQKTNDSFNRLKKITIISLCFEIFIVSLFFIFSHKKNRNYIRDLIIAHKKLKQEKERYHNLVENVPSIVYRCKNDDDWTMIYINGACDLITGYKATDIIESKLISFNELIHPEDRMYVKTQLDKSLKEQESFEVTFRLIHASGEIYWVLEKGRFFHDEQDNLYLEGVITDISALKGFEFELKELNRELDHKVQIRTQELEILNKKLSLQASELKSSLSQLETTQKRLIISEKIASLNGLVVGVAHELNTPLGNLTMLVSMQKELLSELMNRVDNSSLSKSKLLEFINQSDDFLIQIERSIVKMISLSDSFKSIAVEQNKNEFKIVNLKQEIESAIFFYKNSLEQQSIKTDINIDTGIVVKSSSIIIHQIFSHLISNSIIHGFEDRASGLITISAKETSDKITLTYHDDGKGIANSLQKHVFEPFITSRRGEGSIGLGLNVVFNLLNQGMGGDIQYINNDQGTMFVIELPNNKTCP